MTSCGHGMRGSVLTRFGSGRGSFRRALKCWNWHAVTGWSRRCWWMRGCGFYAIDASPRLLAAFRQKFPEVQAECAAAEDSSYFGRTFDGVIAWGLIFLLPEETQRRVLAKMAKALKPGGRLLFTAPRKAVTWTDSLTGLESYSLGMEAYEALLRELRLDVEPGRMDVGENYYYLARKRG
jgi:SAM-dependent methyltransferase